MRKFSVVIPTMWRCQEITFALLTMLENDPGVDEIILIENNHVLDFTFYINNPSKIKRRIQFKNIYVNPAWNLGVKESKNELIALVNDDILLPENFFLKMLDFNFEQNGVVGAYEPSFREIDNFDPYEVDKISIHQALTRWNGFGVLMMMHRDHYIHIPEEIRVWCGDEILYHQNRVNGKQNYMVSIPIKTKMSSTSSDPIFDKIKENDVLLYEEYKKEHNF